MTPASLRAALAASLIVLCGASPAEKERAFHAEKKEIATLAGERVRVAHFDYQRILKMGEDRLRKLHENYKVQKSTPPTALDADVQELRTSTQLIRLRRGRGKPVPADPEAAKLIDRYWDEYLVGYDKLLKDVLVHQRIGTPDSQVYWEVMKRFADLRARTLERLIYNSPAGEPPLEEVLLKNEWKLLRAVEPPNPKTRGKVSCVVAAEEHPRQVNVDVAPFYHSQGLLPTSSPLGVGAFTVPANCRTVIRRESGTKLIFRVSKGKGVAYIGGSEKELQYGYLLIPPDAAYYFENVTDDPLDLEYIALSAS